MCLDVTFFKNIPYFQKPSLQGENLSEDQLLKVCLNSIDPPIDLFEITINPFKSTTEPTTPTSPNVPSIKVT